MIEEDYFIYEFPNDKKEERKEKKRISEKDRSKYKKTAQKKLKASLKRLKVKSKKGLFKGVVTSIQSNRINVSYEGINHVCSLRGSFKKQKTLMKNIIAVGDKVYFEKLQDMEGVISLIEERHSILSRSDNLLHKQEQIIAVNVDQVIITSSIVIPPLKPYLIDRYIIAAKKGNMSPIIVINKCDLDENKTVFLKEIQLAEELKKTYESLGIPTLLTSIKTGQGLEQIKVLMKDKITVFSGQSGVGKSAMIKALTGYDLLVGNTINKTKKGSHTTTQAQLLSLENGGWCIDTPGIKSFGLWNIERSHLDEYFDEIHALAPFCGFKSCTHTHEPECLVKEKVQAGEISSLRYQSYLSLREFLLKKHQSR